MIAVGTMISLAYYLRVIAAIWMRPAADPEIPAPAGPDAMPAIAGASQEADAEATGADCKVILAITFIAAAATVFFGIIPSPLVEWATAAGEAISSLAG
jgi:NADH-quinone oxidoreductase subunit N